MSSKLIAFSALLAVTLNVAVIGAEYRATSAAAINNLSLQPGDTVIWENGTYSGQTLRLLSSGSAGAPITVMAETPGGVILTGNSQIDIGGAFVVVEGFYFDQSTGSSGVVEFRRSGSDTDLGKDSTIRNCAFDGLVSSGDNKSRWIVIYGERNTVENCSFLNKDSTGACILVELDYLAGPSASHTIQNNYFYDFSNKDGRTNAGDSEAIRVGSSEFQAINANCLIQNNYFVETDGENEIITNKSRNNTYLHNTFRRSRGGLVLRHGSGAWVEGNFFLGEGKTNSGGIRITDENHTIINNYLEGLRGVTYNASIVWMGGNTSSGGSSSGYQYVDNVTVAFNTLYDTSKSIYMNDLKGNRAPINSIMANNLIYSTRGELITGEESLSLSGVQMDANIMFGSTVGYTSSGIIEVDPEMSLTDGLYRPSASGPVADAAAGDYPAVTTDLEGADRPETGKDIGALEVAGATSSASLAPHTDSDVGKGIGVCFLDHLGNLIECTEDLGQWAGYDVYSVDGEFKIVDTGDWLGYISAGPDGWNYLFDMDSWIYMPESEVKEAGAWGYLQN